MAFNRREISLMQSLRDQNRKLTHPGAIIREDILPELGITQAQWAVKQKFIMNPSKKAKPISQLVAALT